MARHANAITVYDIEMTVEITKRTAPMYLSSSTHAIIDSFWFFKPSGIRFSKLRNYKCFLLRLFAALRPVHVFQRLETVNNSCKSNNNEASAMQEIAVHKID